jgi:hypothetical protein
MVSPSSAPPDVMKIETISRPRKHATLMAPVMTSDSPNQRTLTERDNEDQIDCDDYRRRHISPISDENN